jgi:gluconolactonase
MNRKLVALFFRSVFSIAVVAATPSPSLYAEAPAIPNRAPDAIIDLATSAGVGMVAGQWRYRDTRIVQTDFRSPDSDGQPTGAPIQTYDYEPHAGRADFDDSKWPVISPESLKERRSTGRLCFNWYRINITVPERIGDFATAGSTAVFETSLDDYAEVWVNGELPRYVGQSGGSVISGWNSPNRLVIGRNLAAGQKIQLAIFGINGPISNPPTNFIWIRLAKLSFYHEGSAEPYAITPSEVNVEVVRNDPAINDIVPPNAKIMKLAEGFKFTEGPVWIRDGNYLLFSDPNNNRIYKYTADGQLSMFREKSGYAGADIAEYGQPGSNGLTTDPQGRLTINQHGNRRVIRVDENGDTVLADRYDGKRLNSPNDLVYRSDGTLFFTDPPFGLPKFGEDPRKELAFSGVFSLHNGKLQLISTDMKGPNGIAFSPDEKFLYVGDWDDHHKVIYRYEVNADGTFKTGSIFFDMTSARGEDAIDGIKVDARGDLFVSGPGGVWVLSGEGKHLGTIVAPMHPHNMAWGDADHQTLYLTAKSGLYKIRLNVKGAGIPR